MFSVASPYSEETIETVLKLFEAVTAVVFFQMKVSLIIYGILFVHMEDIHEGICVDAVGDFFSEAETEFPLPSANVFLSWPASRMKVLDCSISKFFCTGELHKANFIQVLDITKV